MDTSDPSITFSTDGVCKHCLSFDKAAVEEWFPNDLGRDKLLKLIDKIKIEGKDNEYDCILGLSGGLDSSYLAIKVKEWGLRPLAMHVDAGWNTELSVANIEKIIKYCNYDLHTRVVDWNEMRDLHLAYLRSGISNQDVPQDHVFFASLYQFASKSKIKYILSGSNIATEGILPSSWHGSAMDATNLKAIHKIHGEIKLEDYKTISFFDYFIWYPLIKGMKIVKPLNLIQYNKEIALKELNELIGYKSYPRKHGESLFTKLFQNYYLPTRFCIDKRRAHLSSLIVSGQMLRNDALNLMNEPLYEEQELENDINFFCKKIRISRNEFESFLNIPLHYYFEYPNWGWKYRSLKKLYFSINKLFRKTL
jgi:N-acetyl sugar amidotransferase